jgi:hypothetical protein
MIKPTYSRFPSYRPLAERAQDEEVNTNKNISEDQCPVLPAKSHHATITPKDEEYEDAAIGN